MRRSHAKWGVLFGFWLLVALAFEVYSYLALTHLGQPYQASYALWNVLSWLLWVPLTPVIVHLARRFSLDRAQWRKHVMLHFAASLGLSLLRILTFVGIRMVYALVVGEAPLAFLDSVRAMFFRVMFIDVLIYAVAAAVVHAFDYYHMYRERDLRTAHLETRLAEAQLQALRMQLNPHFLFNTLNAIYVLMEEDVGRARRMLIDLSDLLRTALENDAEQEVPLAQELAFLKQYLQIEQVRFQDRLVVEMQIEDEAMPAMVPNLILQPLVENALKHGIARYAAGGQLSIRARRAGDVLELEVQDNGPGFDGRPFKPFREGIGLRNTRERLAQLYGRSYSFRLCGMPEGGLTASIQVPFRNT